MGRAIIKPYVAGGWLALHEETALKKIERYNRTAELQHLGKLLSKIGRETAWG